MSDDLRALQAALEASAAKTGRPWALIYTNTWKLISLHETERQAREAGLAITGPHSFVVVPVEEVGNYPVRLDTI